MTAAAKELRVTHGAVSRHVRNLEETYGVPLLLRGGGSLEATHEGARLADGLAAAFGIISASLATLRPAPLRLSCSATIMMNWLIPRMGRFHSRHPRIHMQLNMGHDTIDLLHEQVSVAIRNSVIPPPRNVLIRDLMTEWIGPVCSPEFAADHNPITLASLEHARLLATRTRPTAWDEWLDAIEQEPRSLPPPKETLEHFYLLIQAACCGLGMALVPKMLVEADIASGKLVAPLGFVPGKRKLVLWISAHLASRPDTLALTDWLTEEMQA